jgi:DNA-binding transcriptional LysR family regulator
VIVLEADGFLRIVNNPAQEENRAMEQFIVQINDQADVGTGWLGPGNFIDALPYPHNVSLLLFDLDAPLNDDMLRPWPLIQIADNLPTARPAGESWTFSTIDAAIETVMYRVGYGWLPEERIQTQLEQGTLKVLPLSHGIRRATPLHLIVKRSLAPLDEQVETLLRLFRQDP